MTSEVRAALEAREESVVISRVELQAMMDDAAEKAARKVLFEVGISADDAAGITAARQDMAFLRNWRCTYARMVTTVGNAVVMAAVAGLIAALWVGVKIHVLKQP
ncbi:hypothetical protein ACT6QH_01875 [Xanthobacter sp. TB0139]|uniref:hypothetical protein n=1 Tax=Xanthobacter sp. TB0139 TaxID=3459178 RepID=UPI0040390C1D